MQPVTGFPPRRLAWATDVHLNFLSADEIEAFGHALRERSPDAVLITGDIAEAPSVEWLLTLLAETVKAPLHFVLGNHDYYRGSIPAVRDTVTRLARRSSYLSYLPVTGVVPLGPDAALIGVDGWADGRLGDYRRSPVMLNDYLLIEQLAGRGPGSRLAALNALGDAEAERLTVLLDDALGRFREVFVGTHVPPFREACWHDGKVSNDDWLPHFACRATGDALRRAAEAHPDRKIRVLCGHTHSAGRAEILPNLDVLTGGAAYGEPQVQGVFEIGA